MAGGFEALGLFDELVEGIKNLEWTLPTDVQDEAIPLILGGGDVCVSSETGSGKTAAFCLPIIQCVCEILREKLTTSDESFGAASKNTNKRKHEYIIPVEMNNYDKDKNVTISEENLECNALESESWVGIRATHGVKTGKFYFEAEILGSGLARIGCSTMQAHLELGKDSQGFGYGGTGMRSWNNSFEQYGVKFGNSNTIGCYLDLDNKEILYSVDGVSLGKAFDIPFSLSGSILFPAICVKNCKVILNFGHKEFKYFRSSQYTDFVSFNKGTLGSQIFSHNSKEVYVQNEGPRKPLALILVPTKDLAEQVYNVLLNLSTCINDQNVKISLVIGGSNIDNVLKKEIKDGMDILVGTVGKVLSLVESKVLDLSRIRFFIMDEADHVLDNDGANSVMRLFSSIPKGGTGEYRLQVCFFSATLHTPFVRDMTNRICMNPTWIDLKGPECIPETVHHVLYKLDILRDSPILDKSDVSAITDGVHPSGCTENQPEFVSQRIKEMKQQALLGILTVHKLHQAIIFCRTNLDCENLESFLTKCGQVDTDSRKGGVCYRFSCCVLAGIKSMEHRRNALEKFKDGEIQYLICTDVAARGIDVKHLPFMINMTLPDDPEVYIHRVGRVGRNHRLGLAISIIAPTYSKEKVWYHRCRNRGAGCKNTSLVEKGGCCIWQDESDKLAAIEGRLHQKIDVMEAAPLYNLPLSLGRGISEYGDEVSGELYVPRFHLEILEPKAQELALMERDAQNMFLHVENLLFSSSSVTGHWKS